MERRRWCRLEMTVSWQDADPYFVISVANEVRYPAGLGLNKLNKSF